MDSVDIASFIDHTLLKPDATAEMIEQLCSEAVLYRFYSVCVNPVWVPLATEHLKRQKPLICSVAGFPLGCSPLVAAEAEWAVDHGAGEIDMVLPIGLLKQGDYQGVKRVIREVVEVVSGTPVKVILETCLLTREEKVAACSVSREAGAAFVKTSTGFAGTGATTDDVRLLRASVGTEMGVKASGGVRDYATAVAMISAGASRIGTSSGIKIINGASEGLIN